MFNEAHVENASNIVEQLLHSIEISGKGHGHTVHERDDLIYFYFDQVIQLSFRLHP